MYICFPWMAPAYRYISPARLMIRPSSTTGSIWNGWKNNDLRSISRLRIAGGKWMKQKLHFKRMTTFGYNCWTKDRAQVTVTGRSHQLATLGRILGDLVCERREICCLLQMKAWVQMLLRHARIPLMMQQKKSIFHMRIFKRTLNRLESRPVLLYVAYVVVVWYVCLI